MQNTNAPNYLLVYFIIIIIAMWLGTIKSKQIILNLKRAVRIKTNGA